MRRFAGQLRRFTAQFQLSSWQAVCGNVTFTDTNNIAVGHRPGRGHL